ncbi:MAG TPA: AMP-binding protein [Bryobacteraceae bacterium]|nr:AMP-binding protein [Bryobacteraceae bacterium]
MWSFSSYPERVAAVCDSGGEITYGELDSFADTIRDAVPPRRLVFCLCSNTLGSLAGYTAFRSNRMVPLLLSSELNQALLDQLIQRYRPAYLWAPRESQRGYPVRLSQFGYELLETRLMPPPLHDELALLLTTSGSTGSPNLVRLSYDNLEANTASIVEYLGVTDRERPITTLPMEYSYGLSIINSHLEAGATLLLTTNGLMQKEFWTFFKERRATSFGGVPYTYEMLARLRFSGMTLPSLKTMTQAGGKLSADLQRQFAQLAQATGRRFFVMYGQTEATARISYLPPERLLDKCGSIGIAIPGGELSVADADGELVYRGRNVALGYAVSAGDLIKGSENGGVLATGDIGRRDADGYFYISGRKKRFIKIFGNRVNLDEVERLIQGAFPDLGVACAGSDDHMAIFLTGNHEAGEVKRFISEKTGLNPAAFAVTLVPAIPRNDAGKTLYAQLEAVPCGR